jgi:hypothetical protein
MAINFRGSAIPLDQPGIEDVTDFLRVGLAELWAVLAVETRGFGYLPDRRPIILFERHIFSRETEREFDGSHPDISGRPGGYGRGGANQYLRLERAIALDRTAALRSASWGLGQVMGFNAATAGFADAETMIRAMAESEREQLFGMANFIRHKQADRSLRTHDWREFARLYNGAGFERNNYHTRLASAFQRYNTGFLPDLIVRAAQVYLVFLGFDPGPVDGEMGRLTRSALNEFQESIGAPVTDDIDGAQLRLLKERLSS